MLRTILFTVQTHYTFLRIFYDGLLIFAHPDDVTTTDVNTYPAAVTFFRINSLNYHIDYLLIFAK